VIDGTGLTGSGVTLRNSSSRVTVEGLTIRNFLGDGDNQRFGILVVQSGNVTLRENTIESAAWQGISAVKCSDGLIEGNTIRGSVDSGIEADDGHNMSISRNILAECGFGIALGGGDHNTLSDNKVAQTINNGIWVAGSSNNLITRNVIDGTIVEADGVILFDGSRDNVVSSNTLTGAGGAGILVTNGSNGNTLVNNLIFENTMDGICVDGSHGTKMMSNTITDSGQCGVVVRADSNNNQVLSNAISGSGNVDLYWDQSGTGNHWANNSYATSDPETLP
jgi:nitrous oxidase accessory protein